jgi:hypothetical protein
VMDRKIAAPDLDGRRVLDHHAVPNVPVSSPMGPLRHGTRRDPVGGSQLGRSGRRQIRSHESWIDPSPGSRPQ